MILAAWKLINAISSLTSDYSDEVLYAPDSGKLLIRAAHNYPEKNKLCQSSARGGLKRYEPAC